MQEDVLYMSDYFCGWYFKCQSDQQTLAVIPAIHKSKKGKSCSVQLITNEGTWRIFLPYTHFRKQIGEFDISVGKNYFGEKGISLCLNTEGCSAIGSVRFGKFSSIRYDIMGPFRYLPFMECRHSILSMKHSVMGELCVNGVKYRFQDGIGYIEGDRGYSFPKEYAWTQCSFENGSLMLSIADILLGPFHFNGVICIIQWQGREYRLATYLGAKAVKIEKGEIVVRQRDMTLSVKLLERSAQPLLAPINGSMNRTIHESAACRAAYCFQQNTQTIFSFETTRASFEYEYFS